MSAMTSPLMEFISDCIEYCLAENELQKPLILKKTSTSLNNNFLSHGGKEFQNRLVPL